jgi:hypothetical protein
VVKDKIKPNTVKEKAKNTAMKMILVKHRKSEKRNNNTNQRWTSGWKKTSRGEREKK